MYTVLYIDDDPARLTDAKLFLERTGEFTVRTGRSVLDALAYLNDSTPDAIVSFYPLPGPDGTALPEAVRQRHGDLPFVIITERDREEEIAGKPLPGSAMIHAWNGSDPAEEFGGLAQTLMQAISRTRMEEKHDATGQEPLAGEDRDRAAGRDATEHNLPPEERPGTEPWFRVFSEATPDAIVMADEEGKVFEWSPGTELLSGIRKERARGRYLWDLAVLMLPAEQHTRELKEDIEQKIRSSLATGIPPVTGPHVVEIERPDRTRAFARQVIVPIRTGTGFRYCWIMQDITGEKNALDAMNDTERKYQDLADLLPQMVFGLDLDLNVTYANRHAQDRFGFTDEDIRYGISALSCVDPSQQAKMTETARKMREGAPGESQAQEYTAIGKDGRAFPVLVYSTMVYKGETPSGFFGVIIDITSRKTMEYDLRESEKKFRTVFEYSPYPIAVNTYPDGSFLAVNPAFLATGGFTEQEVLGKTPAELGLLSARDSAKLISSMAISGKIENMPVSMEVKGGKKIHVLFSSIPVTIGNRQAVISIAAEVTKLRKFEKDLLEKNEALRAAYQELAATEEKLRQNYDELSKNERILRESEEKFRLLAENTLEGVVITDPSGKILFVNGPAGRIVDIGDSRGLVGTRNVLDFAAPESRAEMLRDLKKVAQGIDAYLVRYRLVTAENRDVWVECLGKATQFQDSLAIFISMRNVTERHQAEERIRESENKFSTVFRNNPFALTLVSANDGVFADVNDAFEKNTGYTREEVVNKTSDQLELFPDHEDRQLMVSRIRERGIIQNLEIACRVRDGGMRTCLISSNPVLIKGKPYILSVIEDITGYRQTEEKLRNVEGLLRMIAEHARDMIYRMSVPDGRYEYVSPSSVNLMGYTPEEFYSHPALIRDVIHPAWQQYFSDQWKALLENKVPEFYEYQIIDRAGQVRWVNQRNVLVTGRDGRPAAIEGIVTDVTRQKETEHRLRRSEQRALAVSENAGSWIWEVDKEGVYRYCSSAVLPILGYRPDELVGTVHFYDLFEPSVRDDQKKGALEWIGRREPIRHFENTNVSREGVPVILDTSGTPVFDEDGTFIGYCGVSEDITGRKKIENALRMANSQLNLLSSVTRHDILNKTVSILGFLSLAQGRSGDPVMSGYLEELMMATKEIQAQIEFTRVYKDLGTHEPQWIALDSAMPVHQVPSEVTFVNETEGISVFSEPLLEKVFFNLLDNSVRHGEHVTRIRVSSFESGDGLTVVWEDNGTGIPKDQKEQIFESGVGKNTGLGMFLVREILSLTGIAIRETGTPGKGSRFEILVPKGGYRRTGRQVP